MKHIFPTKRGMRWILILVVILLAILIGVTLSSGPPLHFERLEQSGEMDIATISEMQHFSINGIKSSNNWIEQSGDSLTVTGIISGGTTIYHDAGAEYYIMFVPEILDGLTVYHTIPFFVTADTVRTTLTLDGGNVAINIGEESHLERDPTAETYWQGFDIARLDFNVHRGWIHADVIELYEDVRYLSGLYDFFFADEVLSPESAQRNLRRLGTDGDFWLDVVDGEIFELSGVNGGGFKVSDPDYRHYIPAGYDAFLDVFAPGRLGAATMYHLVRIHFQEEDDLRRLGIDDPTFVEGDITIPVTVLDGKLLFAQ